jgi:hypothetical protein
MATCVSTRAQDADPEKVDPFIAEAIKADAKDTPLRKLQKDLCREEATAVAKMKQAMDIGKLSSEDFIRFHTLTARLADDLMELMDKPESKIKCLELRVNAFKQLEHTTELRVEAGREAPQELNLARANRIRAEIKLLKFKAELEKEKK